MQPEEFLGKLLTFHGRDLFLVRVIESGPKSRDLSIPSLETEKIMLRYYRLKMYETRKEKNIWLTVTTIEELKQFCHKWNKFCLFWFRFVYAWLYLLEKILRKQWGLSFFVVATRFSGKAMCTVFTKQHNIRFLVFKRIMQLVRARFALSTVVETGGFVGCKVNILFTSAC